MASILAAGFNVLAALVLPLGFLLWLALRRRRWLAPYGVGALTFFISQMLLRLPLLQLLQGTVGFQAALLAAPALTLFGVGFSAGIFEEGGRAVSMLLMKRRRTITDAIIFGLGHGGVEAVLLVGVNNLALLVAYPATLLATPPLQVLAAGAERLFAVMIHVGLSVLVMRAVAGRKPLWLLAAVVLHGLADGLLGILQAAGAGLLLTELYVAAWGLALLGYTLLAVKKERGHNAKEPL